MSNMGTLCDFHGTIVDANNAWINAFCYFKPDNKDTIIDLIYNKTSRKQIAKMFDLNYTDIVIKYREKLTIRWPVMEIIKKISNNNEIIILSNASKERLWLDINKITPQLQMKILQVYSKEDGNKKDPKFIEQILDKFGFEGAYMIGNDIEQDFNPSKRITNIFVPYKETILRNRNVINEK